MFYDTFECCVFCDAVCVCLCVCVCVRACVRVCVASGISPLFSPLFLVISMQVEDRRITLTHLQSNIMRIVHMIL